MVSVSIKLRPYQAQVGRAVLESVLEHRGLSFSVEIARQGGKNELSAQLELLLMVLHMASGGNLVKAAPTLVPQGMVSIARLRERLTEAGLSPLWRMERGHVLCLGRARQFFLSADPSSNVVGHTAHILLEVDEAQDVDKEKFYKEFRPMGASTNVTTVLYGTPWDGDSLLEEVKAAHLEMERRDGIKRHASFDWQAVAEHNPLYRQYVEEERRRLGEEHPLFRSQYLLLPIRSGGGFLSAQQQAQLQGQHPRRHAPEQGKLYVAGVDLAGEAEEGDATLGLSKDGAASQGAPRRDSTVVTIGELDFSQADAIYPEPAVHVVEHYWWAGQPHHTLFPRLADVLRNVWHCRRVVVDATGVGAGVASFLEKTLGRAVVEPFAFSAQSKSRLAFQLLAAINSGRLKTYARDGSPEAQEFWKEMDMAKSQARQDRTLNFFVEPSRGHDDFLMSLALLVRAAEYLPKVARGRYQTQVNTGEK